MEYEVKKCEWRMDCPNAATTFVVKYPAEEEIKIEESPKPTLKATISRKSLFTFPTITVIK
jgi:hypothetical protein